MNAGTRRRDATSSAIAGTTWMALQPVPITATRLPASSARRAATARCGTRARERRQPRQRRDARLGELPARGDQHVRGVRPAAGLERPARPPSQRAGAPRSTSRASTPARRARLHVGLDLRLRRVAARPARVGRERELVQVRRDVARRARIGVVVPDAAEPLAALEQRHVRDSPRGAAARPRPRRRTRRPTIATDGMRRTLPCGVSRWMNSGRLARPASRARPARSSRARPRGTPRPSAARARCRSRRRARRGAGVRPAGPARPRLPDARPRRRRPPAEDVHAVELAAHDRRAARPRGARRAAPTPARPSRPCPRGDGDLVRREPVRARQRRDPAPRPRRRRSRSRPAAAPSSRLRA